MAALFRVLTFQKRRDELLLAKTEAAGTLRDPRFNWRTKGLGGNQVYSKSFQIYNCVDITRNSLLKERERRGKGQNTLKIKLAPKSPAPIVSHLPIFRPLV